MGDDGNDLIPALVFEQELTTERERKIGIRRQLVRDKRSGLTDPPRRCLHVFTDVESTDWGPKLRERLAKLSKRPFAHVSRPLEIGRLENGDVYVICDKHDDALDSRIRGDAGLVEDDADKTLAWKLFAEIAEGLAALHNAEMPHGELQPKVIGYEKESKTATAWVEGVVEGPLCYWASRRYPEDKDARPYLPRKWQDKEDPSKEADLYALGRIGIAMLLGRPENNWESFDQSDFDRELKKANVGRVRRKLLVSLISPDPEKRPSATVVLQRLRRSECARVWLLLWIVAVVASIVLVAAVTAFELQGQRLQNARVQVEVIDKQLETRRTDMARLAESNSQLEGRGQELSNANTNLRSALEKANQELARLGSKDHGGQTAKQKAERDYEEASNIWNDYACNSQLSLDTLKYRFQSSDHISEDAKRHLRSWLEEFEDRQQWTLRFKTPPCTDGKPCVRGLRVFVDGKLVEPDGDIDFKPGDATHDVSFKWKIGQSIAVEFWDWVPVTERNVWTVWSTKTTTIKYQSVNSPEPFEGVLAVWLLKSQKLERDGREIEVDVVGCPGPPTRRARGDPKRVFQAVDSLLKEK